MPFCQAIYSGVEGSEWENMYNKHAELHRTVSHKMQRVIKKARAVWSMRDAQENGERFCFRKVVNEKLRSSHEQSSSRVGRSSATHGRWSVSPLPQVEAKRERVFLVVVSVE